MTSADRESHDIHDQIHDFMIAGIEGSVDEQQVESFEQLLRENPDALDLYVDYCDSNITAPLGTGLRRIAMRGALSRSAD